MFENDWRLICTIISLLCFMNSLLPARTFKVETFLSTNSTNSKAGNFSSPGYPTQRYDDNSRIFYKFIAGENEKVKIEFLSFKIQGIRPKNCESDYLDIYIDLLRDTDDLLDKSITGRFCGDMLGNFHTPFISTHNIIIMHFYADSVKNDRGFHGTYSFISAAPYNIGAGSSGCDYELVSTKNPTTGYIMSPTFPGVYSDNLRCTYTLKGFGDQRVRLTFVEFDLFNGGKYCPWDYLKVYDGHNKNFRLIESFCGTYKGLKIYSTGSSLFLEFVTSKGRIDFNKAALQNVGDFSFSRRGFNITYLFSDSFVKLNFIPVEARHIRGTECDVRIQSSKRSNGSFMSPGFPQFFPFDVTCTYIIDGMTDSNNKEKVEISFTDFQIRGNKPGCIHGYIQHVTPRQTRGSGDEDEKFCGELFPPTLRSENSRMTLVFNTTNGESGRGFLANYIFRMDYDIDGQQPKQDVCKFNYNNRYRRRGVFNSPWHPRDYPPSMFCTYEFAIESDEFIHISFEMFKLFKLDSKCNSGCTNSDYLEIYEHRSNNSRAEKLHIGTYYGDRNPGPIVSSQGITKMTVIFVSDRENATTGFKAFYQFVQRTKKDCVAVVQSNGSGGIIQSPDFATKYKRNTVCLWTIRASEPTNRILVQFPKFNLEGFSNVTVFKCSKAVVRIYLENHQANQQICGNKQNEAYESLTDFINITFISSHSSLGADGFEMSWTELHQSKGDCFGFKCHVKQYCIAPQLRCNGKPNCGAKDNSDEIDHCPTKSTMHILHIVIGASVTAGLGLLIIIILCICCHRRKHCSQQAAKRKQQKNDDCVEVRYVSPCTTNNTSDHLLTVERPMCQKVSIV